MQVLSSNLLHFVDLHSPNSRQTPQNLLLLPSRQAQATRRQVAVNLGQVKQTSLSFSLLDHNNNQDIRIAQVNSAFLPLLRGIPRNQNNLTHADSNKRYEVFLRPFWLTLLSLLAGITDDLGYEMFSLLLKEQKTATLA